MLHVNFFSMYYGMLHVVYFSKKNSKRFLTNNFFDQVPTKMLHVAKFNFVHSSDIIIYNVLGIS